MRKPFTVLFKPEASREIEDAELWTAENRGAMGAEQLHDAVAQALDLLAQFPRMGARVWTGTKYDATLRRVGVGRTGYGLYYRVFLRKKAIVVLRFRHQRQAPIFWNR